MIEEIGDDSAISPYKGDASRIRKILTKRVGSAAIPRCPLLYLVTTPQAESVFIFTILSPSHFTSDNQPGNKQCLTSLCGSMHMFEVARMTITVMGAMGHSLTS
jgi:hypothetical protein